VTKPGTRVLDIGCGPGKFCVAAAMATNGHFTGVEQREHLAAVARYMVRKHCLSNVEIIHANITEIDFGKYDAFYLYNPFQENSTFLGAIDFTVELSEELYQKYIRYVATQLALAPAGTRVVTYAGVCEEIPDGYELKRVSSTYSLKLWVKSAKGQVPRGRNRNISETAGASIK
jgi:SAM-dependent methyltransferase